MALTKVSYSMIDGAVYNVLDFGADSTGVALSTTAIQTALNAAFTAGGGTVFLPAGTYSIDNPLIVRSNTVLEGVGANSVIKQTENFNGRGNLVHIGYGYEWNENGQSFNPASDNDATIAELLVNDFSNITTINAGARNLYLEGYINGDRPGLGLWFMNAMDSFCDHLWVKDTLIPVTVGNDAAGWQAGCANISVSNIWQISCDPTTDGTDAGSYSWFDLMYMGSAVYVTASRLFNNPDTPAALDNKIQTAGTCYFTISDSIFYGKYADADVGIGVNSNANADTIGANITGNTFIRCTTGVGLYESGGTEITRCSVTGNIFKGCYLGIGVTGATSGDHNISSNLYIDSGLKDVDLGSYTNYTNASYNYGPWYLNGNTNVTDDAIAVYRWNSANGLNGVALVDEDPSSTGRYAIQFIRDGNMVGSIQQTDTNTAYNTSSDYRLKDSPQPMQNALDVVLKLKPCTFTWKKTGVEGQGFIAHEFQEIFPEAVSGIKDATVDIGDIVDQDGKVLQSNVTEPKKLPENQRWEKTGVQPLYQGMDSSFAIATLTAAIQELKAEIDALKGK
jgi:hypothetical protein